jgi:hypothetical protein
MSLRRNHSPATPLQRLVSAPPLPTGSKRILDFPPKRRRPANVAEPIRSSTSGRTKFCRRRILAAHECGRNARERGFRGCGSRKRRRSHRDPGSPDRHSRRVHRHSDTGIHGRSQACQLRPETMAADQDRCDLRRFPGSAGRSAGGQRRPAEALPAGAGRRRLSCDADS